ncbi:MAG: TSUP family transporter [Pseudomonadota bacterium]
MLFDYAMIALAAFAGSLVSGLGGFGGGFIIVIVLTPVVGAKAVVPLIAVYAICGNISRAFIYRKTVAWMPAVHFTLASLPGIYLGARFLKEIPESVFLGFMGSILILILPARHYIKKTSFEPGLKTITGLGLLFGFMSGAAAGSGMLVIAFLNSIGLSGLYYWAQMPSSAW